MMVEPAIQTQEKRVLSGFSTVGSALDSSVLLGERYL